VIGPQVGKWQGLVSPVCQPREAEGAEGEMKVSTLNSLGTIEPEGRGSPNGRARVCASLDSLSRMAEERQKAVDSRRWAVDSGKRPRSAAGEGETGRPCRVLIGRGSSDPELQGRPRIAKARPFGLLIQRGGLLIHWWAILIHTGQGDHFRLTRGQFLPTIARRLTERLSAQRSKGVQAWREAG